MSTVGGGVNIVRDGLVMYLDASNTKSLSPSENILRYSNDISNSVFWDKRQINISYSATTSPDGTQNATLITQNTANSRHQIVNYTNPSTLSGSSYTLSFFVKSSGTTKLYVEWGWMGAQYAGRMFDFSTKTIFGVGVLNPTFVDYPNGWTRVVITSNASLNSTSSTNVYMGAVLLDNAYNLSYTGDGVSGAYFYGFQMESNPFVTEYINTTASPIFRTTWTDISRGGNNGTLVNGPTFSSTNGGSLMFNPTISAYTRVNSTILNDLGGTINVWCYPTGVPTVGSSAYIFSTIGTNSDRFYMYQDNSGNFGIARGNPMVGIGAGVKPLNSWYNIIMTWTNNSISGYFNGVQFGVTTSYTASGTTSSFAIGSYSSPFGTQVFTGNISQVSIYNRALSATEVLQNYNATKSKFGLL